MSRRHLLMLFVLALFWGSSFLFVEVALRDVSPLALIAARTALAALTLAAIVFARGPRREATALLRRHLGPLAVMGVLSGAVPFFLIAWGQQYIDSGFAAILNASAPLWTALLALVFVRAEAVTGVRLGGFVLGFAGVVVLVGASPSGGGRALLGSLAIVASAVCYATTALFVVRRLTDLPPALVALGTMSFAALFTLGPGLAQLPADAPGWKATASLVGLGAGGTAFASLLYFGLIAEAGAPSAMLVTYLVPTTALVWGVTLLGEPLTAAALTGLALVLGGVALGTGAIRGRARVPPASEQP